jgi:glycogen debranching enzyme
MQPDLAATRKPMTSTTAEPASPTPDGDDTPDGDTPWTTRAANVREPSIAETIVTVRAPALAICARDGQIRPLDAHGFRSAHGYYEQDRRILSCSELTVNGVVPEYLGHRLRGASESKHVCMVRTVEDPTPDPVIVIERVHRAGRGETIVIHNHDGVRRMLEVRLRVDADLADISEVRRGQPEYHATANVSPRSGRVRWHVPSGDTVATLTAVNPAGVPVKITSEEGLGTVLRWRVPLDGGAQWRAEIQLSTKTASTTRLPLSSAPKATRWNPLAETGDRHLDALVAQSLADLEALLLTGAGQPREVFAAAGAPWYLTLFGRDSLWTARLLLDVDRDRELAEGTLRVLAGLQGKRDDPETDEQPGKILHELRRRTTVHQQGEVLPPVYYGSMDATGLFVILLAEAYGKGLPPERVSGLMENARAAMRWMRERTEDRRSGGFIRYATSGGGALFNYGWKDSSDAVIDLTGRKVSGPIALAEVQAYAYQAAVSFADVLDGVHGDGGAEQKRADGLREWAAALRARFQDHFLVENDPEVEGRPYFAMALDGYNVPVRGLTSNMGHLLGTGIVSPEQSSWIAHHLVSEQLDSGWGLRTRGADHPRFNPFSYHGGAVWAHDTAIAIRGLALAAVDADREGKPEYDVYARDCAKAARKLSEGLVAAGVAFDYRLPELFSGGARDSGDIAPLPFPSACRPQAWSAAAAIAVHTALAGIRDL